VAWRYSITFTFGGIRTDDRAQVLGEDGHPIPGLLAAGVDVGVYHEAYLGGLSLALVTGQAAARNAVGARAS